MKSGWCTAPAGARPAHTHCRCESCGCRCHTHPSPCDDARHDKPEPEEGNVKKIPTVFVRNPDDMRYVTDHVHPDCGWVFDGEGAATRKYDGTCMMLDWDGNWWARREVKPRKTPPPNWFEVDHDETTGKRVGWEPSGQSSFAKFHAEALQNGDELGRRGYFPPGTYELCGPKINGNPEGYPAHFLIPHAQAERYPALRNPQGYDELRAALTALSWEGIVWHHPDGRMAKLKARDFPAPDAGAVRTREETDRE